MSNQDLDRSTLDAKARDELQQIASAVGVTGVSRLKKSELVDKIIGASSGNGSGNGARKVRSTRTVDDDIASLAEEQNALDAGAEPEIRPVRRQPQSGSDSAGRAPERDGGEPTREGAPSAATTTEGRPRHDGGAKHQGGGGSGGGTEGGAKQEGGARQEGGGKQEGGNRDGGGDGSWDRDGADRGGRNRRRRRGRNREHAP